MIKNKSNIKNKIYLNFHVGTVQIRLKLKKKNIKKTFVMNLNKIKFRSIIGYFL